MRITKRVRTGELFLLSPPSDKETGCVPPTAEVLSVAPETGQNRAHTTARPRSPCFQVFLSYPCDLHTGPHCSQKTPSDFHSAVLPQGPLPACQSQLSCPSCPPSSLTGKRGALGPFPGSGPLQRVKLPHTRPCSPTAGARCIIASHWAPHRSVWQLRSLCTPAPTATAADQPSPPVRVTSLPANSRQQQQQQQLRSSSSGSPSSSLPQRTSDAMECSFEVVAEVVPLSRGASQAGSMCSASSSAGSEDGRRHHHQVHAIDVPQQARESRPSSSSAALLVSTHMRSTC